MRLLRVQLGSEMPVLRLCLIEAKHFGAAARGAARGGGLDR